jgi:tetratricopeptide (TPR) repeat protein
MDKNGQLTFSDDPILNSFNEVFQLIEKGEFTPAIKIINGLMDIDADYPGLIESYRVAKFWNNRENDIKNLEAGKNTAEYLMKQWEVFNEYAESKNMTSSSAFKAAMRYIFFKASDHYKFAFKEQQDTSSNFRFLLNLGDCFLKLEEYQSAIETLEYARSSYRSNAHLLATLGEAYFHLADLPKSLASFREAFFINPTEIDLDILRATPILDIVEIIRKERSEYKNINEWIPIYGFIHDIFYVKRNINVHLVETIEKDIYSLEVTYQKMNKGQIENSNIVPRLINKYLWLLDYYTLQNYDFDTITQIRERLIKIDRNLFQQYFEKKNK